MAVAAMAGSILAGWAVAAGRYRPRRWVRASFWALTPTAAGPGDGPGRGRGGGPLAGAGGVAGGGGDLTAGDGGVQGDDVLGVDEPGGAGPADHLAGGITQPARARCAG